MFRMAVVELWMSWMLVKEYSKLNSFSFFIEKSGFHGLCKKSNCDRGPFLVNGSRRGLSRTWEKQARKTMEKVR